MGRKNLVVIGIVLIILIVAVGIAYQNYEYAKLMKKQVNTLNGVIGQKDVEIAKLTKQIKAKQEELRIVKAELDTVKKITSETNAQINKVTEQPTIQIPQAVVK